MDMDHEIALLYASTPFGIFHPRTTPYSPFSNVVLRVVHPRPRIEDLVSQFLGSLEGIDPEDSTLVHPHQNDSTEADPTPEFDISERMAREMQEQEDREQEMRDRRAAFGHQMGELVSSTFGGFYASGDVARPQYIQQNVNAEAGPSVVKTRPSPVSTVRPNRSMPGTYPAVVDDQVDGDNASKSAGKQRARSSSPYDFPPDSDSMSLLDGIEAALKYEVNKFDFPERLDFLSPSEASDGPSPSTVSPAPVLAHTFNNAPVHSHEQALSELLAGLDAAANDDEEEVRARRLHLVERVKHEMDALDRKVLDLWAATRRYLPVQMEVEA